MCIPAAVGRYVSFAAMDADQHVVPENQSAPPTPAHQRRSAPFPHPDELEVLPAGRLEPVAALAEKER